MTKILIILRCIYEVLKVIFKPKDKTQAREDELAKLEKEIAVVVHDCHEILENRKHEKNPTALELMDNRYNLLIARLRELNKRKACLYKRLGKSVPTE
jgi:uncharacterized protein YktB (UPF0637 family)